MASFKVRNYQTINNHDVIYSFVSGGQIYNKMDIAFYSIQNKKRECKRPQYGGVYFFNFYSE